MVVNPQLGRFSHRFLFWRRLGDALSRERVPRRRAKHDRSDQREQPASSGRSHRSLSALLLLAALAAAQSTPVWQFAGPQGLSSVSYGTLAGRIAAIAADPFSSGVVFAGGLGGVWKTADAGFTWQPLTPTYPAPVGALGFDPQQRGVLYAGTGDPNGAQGSTAGIGLLRSGDDGQTWTILGAATFAGLAISRIAVDPVNSHHLLAAAVTAQDSPSGVQPGLYASSDGGQTWTLLLGPSEAWDFAWDAAHTAVIAAVGTHVYRSTDNGVTFSPLSASPIPAVITRAALCALPGVSGFLLATADANFNLGALLVSSNDGQTWTSVTAPPGVFGSAGAGQGFYDIALAADPTTSGHWWLGGLDLWETKDSGNTWTDLASLGLMHPDQHALFAAGSQLWIGNDGGVWNEDVTGKLHNFNAGLANLGVQSLAASSALPGLWMTSLQNGIDARNITAAWKVVQMGDGGTLALAPGTTQPLVFVAPQLTGFETSTDGGRTFSDPISSTTAVASTPLGDSARAPWLAPIAVDPRQSSTLYVGSWRIWKSNDSGASWTELAGSETTGTIAAISVSPAGSNTVYAATSTGGILTSSDGGATWSTAIATGLPARPLIDLRAAADHVQHLWAALGGRNSIAPAGHVFVSTDGGATWTSRSTGLPDTPVQRLLLDPLDPNTAYAALASGVYTTADGGVSWLPLGTGLPDISVTDLQFDGNGNLLAATFGRGVWSLALPSGNEQIAAVSGSGQSATVGTPLPLPLTAQVTRGAGTPVAGVPVSWSDGGAGGVFSLASSTTGSQGTVSVNYTLPSKAGAITVNATIGTALSAPFSETANPGAAASLVYVGGGNQSGQAGTQLAQNLSVRVIDASGNGVPNVPVTLSDNGASGRFAAAIVATGATGLASASYTLPSAPGTVTVTASTAGLTPISFTLTATPAPDFQWQPASASLQVAQNAVLAVPLQTTAVGGDTAPITLLCLQPATGCSFSANPVLPGAALTLTLNAGSLAAGATDPVVVQGSDGVHTHQLPFSVAVVAPPGLLLASDPGQMILAAGGQGAFTLTLTPLGGLNGPVKLAAALANGASLPTGMSVSFAPSAPTLAGAALSDSLTVVTTARETLAASAPPPSSRPWTGVALLGMLALFAIRRTRRPLPVLALAMLLLMAVSCGGGGGSPAYHAPTPTPNPNGTPSGTYSLLISATSGSISATTSVTMTVN